MTRARNRTPRTAIRAALGAVVLAALFGAAAIALAAPAPATPTITGAPQNPTSSTSASFTFTGETGSTFECKLDASAYASCTSPKNYTGLSFSSHTFRVRARKGGKTSGDAVYTWTVSNDTTPPPVPSITSSPPSPTNSTGASFAFTDAETGVSFLCRVDAAAFAACTSPKVYSGLTPGAHTFQVKAKDAVGNQSVPASWTWAIDTTPPPVPVITSKPDDPAPSAISTFEFTDAESPVTFQCSIENGTFQACTSPFTFTVIVDTSNNGQHQFAVRAIDAAGNASGAASYKWKVDPAVEFTITGDVTGLYPGVWVPIPVRITNPHNFTLLVESLGAAVSTAPASCPTSNFEVAAWTATPGNAVAVPANASSFLVPAAKRPQILLENLPGSNQDACKGVTISLSYSGTATK
jgi:hypothetical protein